MAKIALDGLGGEAIEHHVAGALQSFLASEPEAQICIATSEEHFKQICSKLQKDFCERVELLNGPEKIGFNESPVQALKQKKNSSIGAAVQAVAEGECFALVSFGHTGATVAASQLQLGLLSGVSRAGLAAIVPNRGGYGLLMDVGANLNCKPEHLYQYALMADLYCRHGLAIPEPRVGLLNIGSERQKGDSFLKTTHDLFLQGDFHFVGNVEGGQIFDGSVDVVICTGVTGNMLLKSAESLANMLFESIREKLFANETQDDVSSRARWLISSLASKHDPDSRGASRLLGVKGLVLIGHGNAGEEAIISALSSAYREMRMGLQPAISKRLAQS
ncbi:MAG: phosphate acyltransferase [Planctomycetes bacterium]|nr:phosphate acyltransferase [Planctomycetota bacterium]